MKKVVYSDYKKAYDRFWDTKSSIKPSDIELMINLIRERSKKRNA
jgi:hypothetical protein